MRLNRNVHRGSPRSNIACDCAPRCTCGARRPNTCITAPDRTRLWRSRRIGSISIRLITSRSRKAAKLPIGIATEPTASAFTACPR